MDKFTLFALDCKSRLSTNLRILDYCYLHGKIEEDNGYDLVGVDEETMKYLSDSCIDGVYDAIVLIKKTEERTDINLNNNSKSPVIVPVIEVKECNFYFWHTTLSGTRINRGLIVYKDDKVNNKLARSKFDVRAKIL